MFKELTKLDGEQFAAHYLKIKLGLPDTLFELYEDNTKSHIPSKFSALKPYQNVTGYHTPDIVIGDDLNASLEDLFFLDVSCPRGGLLTEAAIGLDSEIKNALKTTSVGEVSTLELSKQVKPLTKGVRSKLIKVDKKYAKDRDKSGSKSINTGILYSLDSDGNCLHGLDLDAYQLNITALELCHELSGGHCQFTDISSSGLNRVTQFRFVDKFNHIGFVAFVGRGTLANQSYIYVNKNFLLRSTNIVARAISRLSSIDGNSFRSSPTYKSELVLDLMPEVLNDDSKIYPFGNINFMGDVWPGLEDIPLTPTNSDDIHTRFAEAIERRDKGLPK